MLLRFCEPWPPDTSLFHGLQLSTALPPKAHSQNVHQLVHHISLPADSPEKSQIPALRAAQSPQSPHQQRALLPHLQSCFIPGQKYTKITALPLQQLCKTPLSAVKPFHSQPLVCPHCTRAETLQRISAILLLSLKHSLICSVFH